MKIIDLTHTIQSDMPVYPGTEKPIFKDANNLKEHGFIEKMITFYSHTGTHMDAPAHILRNGKTLDSYPADHFIGTAFVISLENFQNREIDKQYLLGYAVDLENVDYVIFNTGWSNLWGSENFFSGFPILSEEATIWLTENFNLKGIGTDAISIDHEDSTDFPVHKVFFSKGLVVIENLANLADLNNLNKQKFQLFCLPLKTKDADGAPIRAIAVIE